MKCSKCKKEVGYLQCIEEEDYCKECKERFWDEKKSSQYYKKLYLKCPFCSTEIDITENIPEFCPGCNTKMYSPSFCGFCESSFTFRKEKLR